MKIVLGISGASGAIYGIKLLEAFKRYQIETHLVISKWGKFTIREETNYTVEEVESLATVIYKEEDLFDTIASGSFRTEGMIVAPCSMKSLAGIACGYSDNLLLRAADVTIKEKRKLLLLVRESPLSMLHLDNMLKLAQAGVIIMPPVPAFYTKAKTLEEMINHTVEKVIHYFYLKE